jgi:vacuolar-type H+-ATPase subunit I/STV1
MPAPGENQPADGHRMAAAEPARDPRGPRFPRREGEGRLDLPTRDRLVGELLDRIERQNEEIAQLSQRQERSERSLKTERTARKRLSGELDELRAQKAAREQQVTRLLAERQELKAREEELERVKETSPFEHELQQAWAQIHELQWKLALARRPWWRRLFDLDPSV